MRPTNEAETIEVFKMLQWWTDWEIVHLQRAFPDALIRHIDGTELRAEFEYKARNFVQHGHDPNGCDLIICWCDNWPNSPVPVWELQTWFSEDGPSPGPKVTIQQETRIVEHPIINLTIPARIPVQHLTVAAWESKGVFTSFADKPRVWTVKLGTVYYGHVCPVCERESYNLGVGSAHLFINGACDHGCDGSHRLFEAWAPAHTRLAKWKMQYMKRMNGNNG